MLEFIIEYWLETGFAIICGVLYAIGIKYGDSNG